MQVLLTVIVLWLSVNAGLPATFAHPQVERVPAQRMAEIRSERLVEAGAPDGATAVRHPTPAGEADVFGMYDDATRTIYLPAGWDGLTAAGSSLLVHEMVHHLQNAAGMTFACAAEREEQAYRAQRAWLEIFGTTLEREFGLDPVTVLVRTRCMS